MSLVNVYIYISVYLGEGGGVLVYGTAFVFQRGGVSGAGRAWSLQAELRSSENPSSTSFGSAVAVAVAIGGQSSAGDSAFVGAPEDYGTCICVRM